MSGGGGLTELGAGAFEGTSLESIVLPASLASVGGRAFADCASLKRIVALSDVAFVDDSALASCAGTSIYCPQTSSGGGASPWYPGLPASGNHVLTYGLSLAEAPLALAVGETADLFAGGEKDAPEGVEVSYSYAAGPLSVDAGIVTAKAPGASEVAVALALDGIELARASRLVQVKRGEAATAPEGSPVVRTKVPLLAQTLSASAEEGISTLAATGVGVGKYFTATVSSRKFKCTVLTEDLEAATGAVSLKNGESSSVNITNLTIPSSVTYNDVTYTVTELADDAYYASGSAKRHSGTLTIPDTVTKIGKRAFWGTYFSGAIVIPDSVTEISESAFSYMPNITSATLPKGLTEIGVQVFYNDKTLASVTFPENPVTIGKEAFRLCPSLAGSITIPSSVISIGDSAFKDCTALTSVSLPDSLVTLGDTAFSGCSNLESASLPASLESIGLQAFSNCTKLKGSTIPPKIKSIGQLAFGNCTAFTTPVILPPTLESLGANAFRGNNPGVTEVLDCSAAVDLGATPFAANATVYCPTSRASVWTGTHNGTISPCSVTLSETALTLKKNDAKLTATFSGLEGSTGLTLGDVTWASEDTSIVTVAASSQTQATVSPIANGKKKVTATQMVNGIPFMSESCEVTVERFKTVKFDTGDGGSAVASQDVETGDKAVKPDPAPERTGYTFVDWYASLDDEKPFDFKNTAIETDTTLHAKWALVISYDAPTDATVSVDADGTTSVSKVSFKSKAAAPVEIVAVASTAQEGLAQLFPDEDSRKNLKLSIAPPGGVSVSFPLSAPADALTNPFLKGKGFTIEANGTIELAYSLVIPSGTRMNYLGDATDGTPLASIAYKLAAVEEGAAA